MLTGRGAVVEDSYLWSGCVVEEGAVVTRSLLSQGVIVRQGAVVGPGCIIDQSVILHYPYLFFIHTYRVSDQHCVDIQAFFLFVCIKNI
jgi:ADP-glucose pyrophosphorylase